MYLRKRSRFRARKRWIGGALRFGLRAARFIYRTRRIVSPIASVLGKRRKTQASIRKYFKKSKRRFSK